MLKQISKYVIFLLMPVFLIFAACQLGSIQNYILEYALTNGDKSKKLQMGTVKGFFPFHGSLSFLKLSDNKGEYFLMEEFHWSLRVSALLKGVLKISSVGAKKIDLFRVPETKKATQKKTEVLYPKIELPFGISVKNIDFDHIKVLDQPAFSVKGYVRIGLMSKDNGVLLEIKDSNGISKIEGFFGVKDFSLKGNVVKTCPLWVFLDQPKSTLSFFAKGNYDNYQLSVHYGSLTKELKGVGNFKNGLFKSIVTSSFHPSPIVLTFKKESLLSFLNHPTGVFDIETHIDSIPLKVSGHLTKFSQKLIALKDVKLEFVKGHYAMGDIEVMPRHADIMLKSFLGDGKISIDDKGMIVDFSGNIGTLAYQSLVGKAPFLNMDIKIDNLNKIYAPWRGEIHCKGIWDQKKIKADLHLKNVDIVNDTFSFQAPLMEAKVDLDRNKISLKDMDLQSIMKGWDGSFVLNAKDFLTPLLQEMHVNATINKGMLNANLKGAVDNAKWPKVLENKKLRKLGKDFICQASYNVNEQTGTIHKCQFSPMSFVLLKPVKLDLKDEVKVPEFVFSVGQKGHGEIKQFVFNQTKQTIKGDVKLQNIPVESISLKKLNGFLSANGIWNEQTGQLNFSWTNFNKRGFYGDLKGDVHSDLHKLSFKTSLRTSHGKTEMTTVGQLGRDELGHFSKDSSFDLTLKGRTILSIFSRFLWPETYLKGYVNIDCNAKGKLGAPHWGGAVHIEDGVFENIEWGVSLLNLKGQALLKERTMRLVSLSGTDGNAGRLYVDGMMSLKPDSWGLDTLSLKGKADRLEVVQDDSTQLCISGDISMKKQGDDIKTEGHFRGHHLKIFIRDKETVNSKGFRVHVEGEKAKAVKEEISKEKNNLPVHIALNPIDSITINRPGDLASTWKGGVTVLGQLSDAYLSGQFKLVKGTLTILSSKIPLKNGLIYFPDSPTKTPTINLTATKDVDGVSASLRIDGDLTSPSFSLTSSPLLSQTDILSLLLFNARANKASLAQGFTLANALLALQGKEGINVLAPLQKILGVDNLEFKQSNVSMSDRTYSNNDMVIGVGKKLSDRVELVINHSTNAAIGTSASINLKLNGHLTAQVSGGNANTTGVGVGYSKRW